MNYEEQNSDVLREIAIPLVSDQECISYNSQYDYSIDPKIQLCAGSVRGNKSASENDSGWTFYFRTTVQLILKEKFFIIGGPLVVRGEDKRWRLVGIASWGFGGKGNFNTLK